MPGLFAVITLSMLMLEATGVNDTRRIYTTMILPSGYEATSLKESIDTDNASAQETSQFVRQTSVASSTDPADASDVEEAQESGVLLSDAQLASDLPASDRIVVPFKGWPGWHELEFWQLYFDEMNHQYDDVRSKPEAYQEANKLIFGYAWQIYQLFGFQMPVPDKIWGHINRVD
jgi:hypothetical protein